jgi:hypothetical protein
MEQGQALWYYCPNPSGYYPYVKSCSEPWQHIPADNQLPDDSAPDE